MALNQTNKLAWIVQTIYKAKRISFEDLNEKWMENEDLSAGQELLLSGSILNVRKEAPIVTTSAMQTTFTMEALRIGCLKPIQ